MQWLLEAVYQRCLSVLLSHGMCKPRTHRQIIKKEEDKYYKIEREKREVLIFHYRWRDDSVFMVVGTLSNSDVIGGMVK